MPRFHCPVALPIGAELELPATAARHVQVLRLQPDGQITLFNGAGGEHRATVLRMGRSDVAVRIDSHHTIEREPGRQVHLALGMPANDRMDWLVEKATELGVTSIQPLHTAHSVLRLAGERAAKKQAHWRSVTVAACEQCGGNRLPVVHPVRDLAAWLREMPASEGSGAVRCVLSLADGALGLSALRAGLPPTQALLFLSGPEGGLSDSEEAQARSAGFAPVSLGPRVLRAETAALAALVAALEA